MCDRLTHYTRTTQSSFESTKLWIEQLQQFAAANVVIALVGNKSVRTCLMIRDARTQVCATHSRYVTYILAQCRTWKWSARCHGSLRVGMQSYKE